MDLSREILEQNLIGSFVKCNEAILTCGLQGKHFSYTMHSELFFRMLNLMHTNGKFSVSDFTHLSLVDRPAIVPEKMSGYDYIYALVHSTPLLFKDDIIHNAEILKDLSSKENLLHEMEDIRIHIDELTFSDVKARMIGLCDDVKTQSKSAKEVYHDIVSSLDKPCTFHSSGIAVLDTSLAGGFYDGFTYGLCGAEKSGKTTLAHTISYNMAKNKVPHMYIALEMGSKQIEQRNIARDLGINSLKFLTDYKSISKDILSVKPRECLWYFDAPGATLHEIISQITENMITHGIKGFILDYWQLVQGKQSRDTEEKHLRDVAQGLADFARRNNLFCVLLAQMNKEGRLFGGNGLRKACDQLYMIEQIENDDTARWLRMDATRYTMISHVGSESNPSLMLNKRIGPYFEEQGGGLL